MSNGVSIITQFMPKHPNLLEFVDQQDLCYDKKNLKLEFCFTFYITYDTLFILVRLCNNEMVYFIEIRVLVERSR